MKEDVITIYEDYPNDLPGYEKHLQNLYVLRDIIGKQNFSLQSDGSLRIKHFVGFFQRGNTRIQILPKIYSTSNDLSFSETELAGSLAFIYRMLWWSGFFNFKKLSKQLLSSAKSDLLEIFIGIFITEFIDLYRKNLFHKYEQQEENQQFIKGKIIFPETIRRNPILKHLHHVKYDEHTINNPLNQIFKALIYNLLSKTKINTNKNKLVVGLTFLQDVDLITLYPNLFNSISFDRLNADFLPLFNLARLFFHNQQPGISEGKENTYSFLVPMHLLFENFIAEILCSFSDDYFVFKYHKPQLYLALENGKPVFQLEPDFTITTDDDIIAILDTKYKYPFDEYGNVKINTDDLYQLTTYSLRYNCNNLALIYPKFKGTDDNNFLLAEYQIQSTNGEITLQVIQVDIMEEDINIIRSGLREMVYPSTLANAIPK